MISDNSGCDETITWLVDTKPDTTQALTELRSVWAKQSDLRRTAAYLHQYIRDELNLGDFGEDPDFLDPEYGQDDPW